MKHRLMLSVMMLMVAVTLNGAAFMSGIRNTGANLGRLATSTASRAGGQMPAVLSRGAGAAGQRVMPGVARRFHSGYAGGAQQGAQCGGRCAALLGGAGAAGLGYGLYQNRDRLEEAGLLPQGWRNATAFAAEREDDSEPRFNSEEESILSMGSFVKIFAMGDTSCAGRRRAERVMQLVRLNPLFASPLVQIGLKDFKLNLRMRYGRDLFFEAVSADPSVASQLADGFLDSFTSARELADADYGTGVFSMVLSTDPSLARKFINLAHTDLDHIAKEGNGGGVIVSVLEADPSLASEFSPTVLKVFNASARDLPRTLEWVIRATLKADSSLAPQFAERVIKDFSYVAKQPDGYLVMSQLLSINPLLAPKFAQEVIDDYADISRTWAGRKLISKLEQVDPSLAPKLEEARLKESLRNF